MLRILANWRIFQRERFPLHTHLPLIFALVLAHAGFDAVLFFVLLSFFFRMRLFDEIKDYATDCDKNPSRPLPRGILRVRDLQRMIFMLFGFEIVIAAAFNPIALAVLLPAQGYSFLMYKEFFIGKFLRLHLTTYAICHTAVMILLSALCSAWIWKCFPWQLEAGRWIFAFACFCIFNVFEFGRKTFARIEEKPGVDSYSKVWGRGGAVALNLSQVLLSLGAMLHARPSNNLQLLLGGAILASLLISGISYAILNTAAVAKVYRAISGVSILLLLCFSILSL
jgi:4-hydroxybenzoate polyprenyltransferase